MAVIQFFDITKNDEAQISKALDGLKQEHRIVFTTQELAAEWLDPEANVISMFVNSSVPKELMDRFPNLQLIACRSTGYNNVDLEAAAARNIPVVNVPSYGEHTVAEYAFGLLLSLSRKLPQAMASATSSTPYTELSGTDLFGKVLGIVGAGRIGQQCARVAKGFGMNVLAYDPYPNEKQASEIGFKYVGLDELLARSDAVTIHAFYTPQNKHLLNAERLAKMKKGSFLINTARGELVDTKALVDSLKSGHLGGAALDVIESEQLLDTEEEYVLLRSDQIDSEQLRQNLEIGILLRMPNVIVTRHNAFNTIEAVARINDTTVENIKQFLGGKLQNRVK